MLVRGAQGHMLRWIGPNPPTGVSSRQIECIDQSNVAYTDKHRAILCDVRRVIAIDFVE